MASAGAAVKMPFVAALACSTDGRPLAMRMTPLKGFRSDSVDRWARQHLSPDAEVISDGLPCFRAIVKTCPHWSIVTGGGTDSMRTQEFTWVNTMLGNVKNAIHATYHSIHGKHLGRYLGEFAYRFKRRFELDRMVERLAYASVAQRRRRIGSLGWLRCIPILEFRRKGVYTAPPGLPYPRTTGFGHDVTPRKQPGKPLPETRHRRR